MQLTVTSILYCSCIVLINCVVESVARHWFRFHRRTVPQSPADEAFVQTLAEGVEVNLMQVQPFKIEDPEEDRCAFIFAIKLRSCRREQELAQDLGIQHRAKEEERVEHVRAPRR